MSCKYMGKLCPSYTEPFCKTLGLSEKYLTVPLSSCHPQGIACGRINGLERSRTVFIIHAHLFCPFSPCHQVVLSSLPLQLQMCPLNNKKLQNPSITLSHRWGKVYFPRLCGESWDRSKERAKIPHVLSIVWKGNGDFSFLLSFHSLFKCHI